MGLKRALDGSGLPRKTRTSGIMSMSISLTVRIASSPCAHVWDRKTWKLPGPTGKGFASLSVLR